MVRNTSLTLAATLMALAAVTTVDRASAQRVKFDVPVFSKIQSSGNLPNAPVNDVILDLNQRRAPGTTTRPPPTVTCAWRPPWVAVGGGYGSEFHELRADGIDDSQAIVGRPAFENIARGFGLRGHEIRDVSIIPKLFANFSGQGESGTYKYPTR